MAKRTKKPPEAQLGRNTEATKDQWSKISRMFPLAPRLHKAGAKPDFYVDMSQYDFGYPVDEMSTNENQDVYWQYRGFCVGWSRAHQEENQSSTPLKLTLRSKRVRSQRVSPLYAYSSARYWAYKLGVNLGRDDGAIVAHAQAAWLKMGSLPWSVMPCTQQIEKSWSNSRYPTASEIAAALPRVLTFSYRLTSQEDIKEKLYNGEWIQVGTPWLKGFLNPNANGEITATGASVGGHAYLIALGGAPDKMIIKNSHPEWGIRSTDERYAGSDGWTNIGVISLQKYLDAIFQPQYFNDGTSEAYAIGDVNGLVPRIDFS